jgi:hypothetical protein
MKTVIIHLKSNSLGDTIAVMPCIEYYISKNNDNVYVKSNPRYNFLFKDSYPNIKFFEDGMTYDKVIELDYNFNLPLQTGFANQLGFFNWDYIRPKVYSNTKERPIKGKYVVISLHSTSQLKYWNHPSGIKSQPMSPNWNELCGMLRKNGLTPVVIEKDETFGIPPYRNGLPSKSNKKIGISIEESINYIQHSEFYIGLSSGLSWLAHAMDKKVAMISNFSEDWHEFDLSCDDYIRITNKSVCHGCWNKVNKEYKFDVNDWYWCPSHKDTDKQFECHTSITPEMVFNQIEKWLNT